MTTNNGIANIAKNPFQITTPEDLSAEETIDLFVDVFTDFSKIIDSGHMFLSGPRGIGKSMMFRYLQTDCQCLVNNCEFSQLPFVGVYIPIKNWSLVKTELKRLDDRHASEGFNEHMMISHIAVEAFDSFIKNPKAVSSIDSDSLFEYYNDAFVPLLDCDDTQNILSGNKYSTFDILNSIKKIMQKTYKVASAYTKKIAFVDNSLPSYEGSFYDYQDFLVPLLSELKKVKGFSTSTIYLLIDDAHFLSDIQTRILNSWISTRTSRKISLKVSTQYDYKNYYTVTGETIDSPHDYSEIDMTTVYTSNSSKSNYKNRIEKIVNRRLNLFGLDKSAEEFFPPDQRQENKINEIGEKYKKQYEDGLGRGNRKADDAYRYARPDYIKSLSGNSKSSYSYSYSGFDQLVHLSSGIVRYFLEPAHKMYSKAISDSNEKKVEFIKPSVQNIVVRKEAEDFLFSELEKYQKEGHIKSIPKEDIQYLSNLVQGLGGLFRQILLSNRSERRVFSIAISDQLSDETARILNIGINLGFFHRSTIGRKNRKSGGRTRLFVMNRRLAPIWNLDPTGFAGYLFVKNDILIEGMKKPQSLLSRVERNGNLHDIEYEQLNLFDSINDSSDGLLDE